MRASAVLGAGSEKGHDVSLRCVDRDLVRVITLDNPQKRNAFDFASLSELAAACAAASADGVRCLVFRGAGDKAFCSGFDIGAIPVGPSEGERPDQAVERTMEAVEAVPCPTIAFLNGSAFGAGAVASAGECHTRRQKPLRLART